MRKIPRSEVKSFWSSTPESTPGHIERKLLPLMAHVSLSIKWMPPEEVSSLTRKKRLNLAISVLCAWRDSITAGQNYHCAPALGSYTRCSGKFLRPWISFMSQYVQAYVLKKQMPSLRIIYTRADPGSGWGRIIYTPVRRGKPVEMDVCRATNRDGSEGLFERIVITQSKNPTFHHQARRSLWGDLWPF